MSTGTEEIPSSLKFAATMVFMMVAEDITFHFLHRFSHWKVIYPYFHKYHHTYKTSVSIVGELFHPVDYIVGVLIPGSVGPNILGKENLHLATYFFWIAFFTTVEILASSI